MISLPARSAEISASWSHNPLLLCVPVHVLLASKLGVGICRISNSVVRRHDRMVELLERMLALHRHLAAAKTGHEKTLLQRQIEATDRQIDRLVYEPYGLTAEEVAVVEEGGGRSR